MEEAYRNFKKFLHSSMPWLYNRLERRKKIVKYLISGGIAAGTDLVLLYFFTDILNIHYLISAGAAFIIAFFVSFFLQKFWTFRDSCTKRMYQQMTMYFIVGVINLSINIGGMYMLVDRFNINYILAQVVMGVFIAITSFLIYNFIIFNKSIN